MNQNTELDPSLPRDMFLEGRECVATLGSLERRARKPAGSVVVVECIHFDQRVKIALRLVLKDFDTRIEVRMTRDCADVVHLDRLQSPRTTMHALLLSSMESSVAGSSSIAQDPKPGDVFVFSRSRRQVVVLSEIPFSSPRSWNVRRVSGPNASRRFVAQIDELIPLHEACMHENDRAAAAPEIAPEVA